ncbi:MAG: flagellar export protein FliJ [Gemmatimonadaceae bacterium]
MFKFRLQRLLDLRAAREREKSVEMVRAEAECEEMRARLTDLRSAREDGRTRLLAPAGSRGTIGQLRNLAFIVEQLDRQVDSAATAMSVAEGAAAVVRQDLNAAHVERRVLDRLRDRHAADWRDAESQADRQTMDSIALSRFTQRATPPGAPATDGTGHDR